MDQTQLINDPRALRALAHPVRLALIERLTVHGPATATQVAPLVGASPSLCSFHLRQLSKYGFVEEAVGGVGRERPWRITHTGLLFDPDSIDPGVRRAGVELNKVLRQRQIDRYQRWVASRDSWPLPWRQASVDSEFAFWMTSDELESLGEELIERLLPLMKERLSDPAARPPGAVPVEMLILAYPVDDNK